MQDKSLKYRSWLPYGFDYYDGDLVAKKIEAEYNLRKLYSAHHFTEISLPTLDFAATFSLAHNANKEGFNFTFKGREGEVLSLRSDLSVLLIKAFANGHLCPSKNAKKEEAQIQEHRFSYIQNIFQDYPWGSGHKREIWQAGIEVLHPTPILNPLKRVREVLELALESTRTIVPTITKELKVLYGDVRVITNLFSLFPQNIHQELGQALHKKNIDGLKELCKKEKVKEELSYILKELPLLFGGKEVLGELITLCKNYPTLQNIFEETKLLELDGLIFDFSLINELSYYTSSVFEAYHPSTHQKIFSGGVYDKLYSEFSNSKNFGAAGFALDLSNILSNLGST